MAKILTFFVLVSALSATPLLPASASAAAGVLGPADYVKILEESKVRYNFVAAPAKNSVRPMTCSRRTEAMRLVVEGQKRSLVGWAIKPEAGKLLADGEALYEKRDLAAAAEKYSAALAVDPQAVTGYYFLGDTLLFGKNDAAAALEQYRKGLALDPTMPSGHFFASTALVHLGRNDEAREEIIRALTYYPSYETVWKIADKSADRWNMRPVVRHKFEPPDGYLGANGDDGVDIYGGPSLEWLSYAMCKAVWANEPQFRTQHNEHGWSMDEERACVANQMMGAYNVTEARLEKEGRPKAEADVVAALPPLEAHLWAVTEAGLLDGYILFEIIGQHCPLFISLAPDEAVKAVDRYIRTFVIVRR